MKKAKQSPERRILIASANPLFGKGLEKILLQRFGQPAPIIRMARDMPETLSSMKDWKPGLVVVDYDDQTINRAEFLTHFVATDQPMQVMLVSLQASGAVVVYDRRMLTPAQLDDWLGRSIPDDLDSHFPTSI